MVTRDVVVRYFSTTQGLPKFGKYDWRDPLNLQAQLSAEELQVQVRSPPYTENRSRSLFDVCPLFLIRRYHAKHQHRLNDSLPVQFCSNEADCVLLLLFATHLLPIKPLGRDGGLFTAGNGCASSLCVAAV